MSLPFKGYPGLSYAQNALSDGMCLIRGEGKATGFIIIPDIKCESVTWRDASGPQIVREPLLI